MNRTGRLISTQFPCNTWNEKPLCGLWQTLFSMLDKFLRGYMICQNTRFVPNAWSIVLVEILTLCFVEYLFLFHIFSVGFGIENMR